MSKTSRLSIWSGKQLDPEGVICATHVLVDTEHTFHPYSSLGIRVGSFLTKLRTVCKNVKFTFVSRRHDPHFREWANEKDVETVVVDQRENQQQVFHNVLREILSEWPWRIYCFASNETLSRSKEQLNTMAKRTVCQVSAFSEWESFLNTVDGRKHGQVEGQRGHTRPRHRPRRLYQEAAFWDPSYAWYSPVVCYTSPYHAHF